MLDRLLEGVGTGQSAVLVIRGEAGIGKTALLRYATEQAPGFRVAQIAGVEFPLFTCQAFAGDFSGPGKKCGNLQRAGKQGSLDQCGIVHIAVTNAANYDDHLPVAAQGSG